MRWGSCTETTSSTASKAQALKFSLKPENILVDREGYIKVTDFGLSKENIKDGTQAHSICGTPEYYAPEVIMKVGYGQAADWWSFGALLYEMLTGLPPFSSKDREKLFNNIKNAEVMYPPYISGACKDLLMRLFNKDPGTRLGGCGRDSAEIMEHPWFSKTDWTSLYNKTLKPDFKPELHDDTDLAYFDSEYTDQPAKDSLDAPSIDQEFSDPLFKGFSFQDEDILAGKPLSTH